MTARPETALPAPARREGNIELLRIVSMLLIIGHHLAWHGVAMQSPLAANRVIATVLFAVGQTGVNCFVMITGYFLAPFRARRFFATLLEAVFYSLGLTLLMKYTGWNGAVAEDAVRNSVLIVSRSNYWFVAMYLGLNALLPLLQPAVKRLGKTAHLWIVVLGAVYLSVIPTLTFRNPSSQYFHQITWFFYLYVLGAYFKKFPGKRRLGVYGGAFLACWAIIALLCLWGADHLDLFQRVGSRQNFFADKNTLPQLLCSCALCLFFAGLRVKPYRWLTLLSGASFGVYLIHDHPLFRGMIWGKWLQVWNACQKPSFWLPALLAPLAIYLACALADTVRKYLLEKPLLHLLAPAFEKLDKRLNEGTGDP